MPHGAQSQQQLGEGLWQKRRERAMVFGGGCICSLFLLGFCWVFVGFFVGFCWVFLVDFVGCWGVLLGIAGWVLFPF